MQHLEEVFRRFRDNGVIINESEREFGKEIIDFLGYTINSQGCVPHSDKIKANIDFPKLKT